MDKKLEIIKLLDELDSRQIELLYMFMKSLLGLI